MIFILGVDALEYDLVQKWNLKNLKQLQYDQINVPINKKIGVPLSPEVWASFLAGKHVYMEFTTTLSKKLIFRFLDVLNIDLKKGIGKQVHVLGRKLGLRETRRIGDLKEKTFLDLTNSKEINAPYYSFDHATFGWTRLFGEGKLSLKQTVQEIKTIYGNRKKQILNESEKIENADVVFAFMHTTDLFQHLLYNHISEIKKIYRDFDHYVAVLKTKVKEKFDQPIFLIISDHGFDFQAGTHSKHAFYSCNIRLMPKPKEITDFFGIIMNELKTTEKNLIKERIGEPKKSEDEKIKERLRKLGYI